MVIDTIPQQFISVKTEITIEESDIKGKNVWIGKDVKLTDEALAYAIINKIKIHKSHLDKIDEKNIIEKYKKRQDKIAKKLEVEKTIGIKIEELKELMKD